MIPTTLPGLAEATVALADTPTRLSAMKGSLQERLLNWGYLVTDSTAMRKHVDGTLATATAHDGIVTFIERNRSC